MDELEILIQAILSLKDVTESKKQIVNDLPELEKELQSDKNARVKIIAGLDINKSKSFIESQLDTLSSKIKVPAIEVGIGVGKGLNNGGQINQLTQSVKEYNQELNKTATVQSKLSNRNYASDNSVFIEQIKTLENEKTAVDNLVNAFNNYGIAVKNATSTKTLDGNGNLNNLTVSVTSKTGEIESFKYVVQEANGQTVLMLQNITATDNAVQRLIQSQAQYNDQLNASAIKLQTQLDKVKSSAYTGSKPIDFSGNEKLIQQWNIAQEAIEKMKSADKSAMVSMKANAEAEISKLKLMVTEIKNAEYAATELRSKDIGNIKDVQTGNLDKFISQINNSKVPIQMLEQDISNLRVALSNISKENPKSLTEFLNQFDVAKSKFGSLKEFYKSIGSYNNDLEKMAASWKKQGVYTDELKSKIATLKTELNQVAASGNTAELTKWRINFEQMSISMGVNSEKQHQLNNYLDEQVRLTKLILSLQTQIATLNPNKDAYRLSELQQQLAARQQELSVLQSENVSMTELMTTQQQQKHILEQTTKEQKQLLIAQQRAADIEQRSEVAVRQKAERLKAQIANYEAINSKAAKIYKNEFDSLKNGLASAKTTEDIAKLQTQFTSLKSSIKVAGREGQTFFQKMAEGAKKFSAWMSLTTIISYVIRDIRKMLTTVVELDTALIDLKKTFKGTESDLKEFYYSANDVAKQLGVTTAEVIKQAAAWSRLGFSTKEQAIEMSKLSSMFASISPGMDIDTATDGLLSIIKAFGYETNEVLDGVMSKINKVGNEFGTSNSEIVEMLKRSSSAMKEANNNLADTIALETAAVEITRDAASVGTAFKTLSMRLRGYDEEVEDYVNDVQALSGEIADLTKTAKTPGGISLFTDEAKTEYKSTTQLLREISEIYDELDDKTQAGLLEKIAGRLLPEHTVMCA